MFKKFFKKKVKNDSRTTRNNRIGYKQSERDIFTKYSIKQTDLSWDAKYEMYAFARKIVELPLKDLFQIGRTTTINSENEEVLKAINEIYKDLEKKIYQAWTIARIQGNSILFLVMDDEEPQLEANYKKLKENSLINTIIYKDGEVTKSEIENNPLNKNFGEAKTYRLIKWGNTLEANHTRCLHFKGDYSIQNSTFMKDGVSVLKKCDDVLGQEHDVIKNIGTLVKKANVDNIKIQDLYTKLCEEDENRILGAKTTEYSVDDYVRKSTELLNNENILLTDTNNSLERHSINFNGLTGISDHYIEILASLEDIPVERFASKTQASLNNTGGNNMENYYSKLRGMQSHQLQPVYEQIDKVISSMFGVEIKTLCNDPNEQTIEKQLQTETTIITNAVSLINGGLSTEEGARKYIESHNVPNLEGIVEEFDIEEEE